MTIAQDVRQQAAIVQRLLTELASAGLAEDEDAVALSIDSETDLSEAIEAAVDRIAELDAMSEALQARESNYAARRARFGEQKAAIKRAIVVALDAAQVRKVETPTATVYTASGRQRVMVDDPDQLPEAFLVPQPPKPNLTAIKHALESGPVPGASLSAPSVVLNIRTR